MKHEDILIDFFEHPGFELFYHKHIDKEIKKTIWRIVDMRIEEDERKYTKMQLERMFLRALEWIRENPLADLNAHILNNNETVSAYAKNKTKKEKMKKAK